MNIEGFNQLLSDLMNVSTSSLIYVKTDNIYDEYANIIKSYFNGVSCIIRVVDNKNHELVLKGVSSLEATKFKLSNRISTKNMFLKRS